MAVVTYVAKREIEPTGFAKAGTDLQAIASDDSINAGSGLSGLLTDQWLQTAGFVRNAGWFQVKSNSTSAKILTNTPPVSHLRLPGVSGNYASTPDTAANSITSDIDIRVKVSLIDWTPAAATALISKWIASGNQRSYFLRIEVDGKLSIFWSADGTVVKSSTSTIAIAIADGSPKWVRAVLDVDNGAAGNDAKFYTSDDGVVFTQLGTTVTTAGTTSIFNSTSGLEVGSTDAGTLVLNGGRWYYAEVRNGIDGAVVAAFDPTRGTRGAGSLVALTGETWTINASGTPPALLQGPLIQDEGAEYLSLPGVAGNYASTPDTAANSITGDIDVRAKLAPADWTPGAAFVILGKWVATGNQRAYMLRLETTGALLWSWSTDGTATTTKTSTVIVGAADGSAKWVRVIHDVNNGAAGNDVKFYTSDDGVVWTQLGATLTTGGTTSIFNSTAIVEVGSETTGTLELWSGKLYYAEVRTGIDGPVVAVFDPGRAAAGASSLTAYTGEVWTINTSGSPAAALVRLTPVTITGYKRGFGQSYSIEFKAEAVNRKVHFKRNEQRPIGGGAAEVLFQYSDAVVDVTTEILSEASQVPQFREFLASVAAGEVFTFDRYGTIASPVDPRQAQLESVGYDEQRVMSTMQQRIPFSVRLLP